MTANTDTGDTNLGDVVPIHALATGNANEPPPREALITTAVSFLQNAKVRPTTLVQKQKFLRSKGLTATEIQMACEKAGVFSNDPNNPNTVINMDITSQTNSQMAIQPRQTTFGRVKEILNSMALLSGLAYAVYYFWKNYILPFFFGKKKRKPIDKALEDIEVKVDNRIDEVNNELTKINKSISDQQNAQNQNIYIEFQSFRSDLETIKGLLLNRKQFASPIETGPASIPAWQLSSSPHRHHRHSPSDDNEKTDDGVSGSGSSETEVVTKNSDSSLEIMEIVS